MTRCVAYSVSPFGTGDLRTGITEPFCSITDGIMTITEPQTDNIGVGDRVTYADGGDHQAVLMPARLKFTSGGTYEVSDNDIIIGDSSGAMAQVRMVEQTSGDWSLGTAAGNYYLAWQTGIFITETLTIYNNSDVCSIAGDSEGNSSNIWPVKNLDGTVPSDVSDTFLSYLGHEYTSFAALESGFVDSNHINTSDLVASDLKVYAVLYYDHDDHTPDSTSVYINYGIDGPNNYLTVFAPIGQLESINKQRSNGVYDENKQYFAINNLCFLVRNTYTKFYGLQIKVTWISSPTPYGIKVFVNPGIVIIGNCIILGIDMDNSDTPSGIIASTSGCIVHIFSNLIKGWKGIADGYGINQSNGEINAYNTIVADCYKGVHANIAKNVISIENVDDFEDTPIIDYCASNDGDGTNAVLLTADDYVIEFKNHGSGDYHLNFYSVKLKNTGINDPGNGLYITDIDGDLFDNTRGWSIGIDRSSFASEYVLIPEEGRNLKIGNDPSKIEIPEENNRTVKII
jgi:hypothetical protein